MPKPVKQRPPDERSGTGLYKASPTSAKHKVREPQSAAATRLFVTPVPATARAVFRSTPLERIRMVRTGVPARFVVELSNAMALPRERLYATTGLARATIDRKVTNEDVLARGESEAVVGLTQLIGQAAAMVEESGTARGFDAARWVGAWLQRPHAALDGKTPAEFMDTGEGRALVANVLAQQQSGGYA
jgi:putative toxin-antitoxin system antitoxin component (TIGR02293 family)